MIKKFKGKNNASSIATASAGFAFAALGAFLGLCFYAGTLYINDRNKQEQNQFTNLFDDKERLPIIREEVKLKETVINFLLGRVLIWFYGLGSVDNWLV